jgi:eukaryotic-like serine/threonine-protein kinase
MQFDPLEFRTMSPVQHLVDPYADTLELPINWDTSSITIEWERAQVQEHLAAHFQIVRELGRGGMGVVFLARDIALHRLVAIKVLRHEFSASDEHRERFRREARMTARLSHPNIVPVHSFGEIDDLVYIVMKYVHGESLAERLRRERTVSADATQRILRDLALALDYAHGEGVVHRDLKAENILLERGTGRAMLTDFGVALLRTVDPIRADAARAFGTPHYMSPEQAAGEPDIDGRSDLYSLGVLGYYMLTGELPFDGLTFEALAAKHIADAHVPLSDRMPGLSAQLSSAIERCLLKDRHERWHSGCELADALAMQPKRRWFARRGRVGASVTRTHAAAELAMIATAVKAVLWRWTTI